MSSLLRLHWHNKLAELHFGFKSSLKRKVQSPMVDVVQRYRRVSVTDHQSNFPLLLRRHHETVSASVLQLPLFPAAKATFTYKGRGSYHQYIWVTRKQKM